MAIVDSTRADIVENPKRRSEEFHGGAGISPASR